MTLLDGAAFGLFALSWLLYASVLKRLGRGRCMINSDMTVVRRRWMINMAGRENRFLDSQLMGHALNSASFFASTNLIVIAAAAGALFGGDRTYQSVQSLVVVAHAPRILFEFKLAVVLVVLARGLLDFIWGIRQMNYCLAAIGAAPLHAVSPEARTAYGEAAAEILNPALSSFNTGVRGYYFAIAAASWLAGPLALMIVTVGAVSLLIWRQAISPSAGAVRRIRNILEGSSPTDQPPAPR